MTLTAKQLYDLKQLVKREWCEKESCEGCLIESCKDGIWTITNIPAYAISVPDKELNKAKKLLKQHDMVIAEKILLEG